MDLLDDASNFFAGWGDALTFGGTARIRSRLGADSIVNKGSGLYFAGSVVGTVHQDLLLRGAGKIIAAKRAAQSVNIIGKSKAGLLTKAKVTLGVILGGIASRGGQTAKQSGRFITVFHIGDLAKGISTTRTLSTATSLQDLQRVSSLGGKIYTFRIPEEVYEAWQKAKLVGPLRTIMGSVQLDERLFSGRVAKELGGYLVK